MIKMALMALRKLAEVILAAFTFGIVVAIISSAPAEPTDPAIWSFEDTFLFVFVYSPIFFLFIGIPASIFIEGIMKKINLRNCVYTHLVHFILYVSAGSLLGTMVALFFIAEGFEVYIVVWSTIAALCFYVALIGLNKIIQFSKEHDEE
ncbi:hypothetical protein HUG15_16970 [Salicibibacter cibarius]|uniref:Uncharacterized protein n=1 Tax=Salicibibacter cibarius TaxID=2743000 RepID=A0A7T6Z4Z6_9BACI|nr:hypothetical protein [Salicibibacter cibarius]QQK77100.1 hypothetical protein HUG15_16970 [Salicibibacter cibarius]